MFEIAPATPEDQESIRLLERLNPYPATPPQGDQVFFIARSGQAVVGTASVEMLSGDLAMVRQLAVIPGYRKRDIARQLLLRLIAFSEERQAREIYAPGLFAEDYFRRFGFTPCAAADLPPALCSLAFPGNGELNGNLMRRTLQNAAPEETSRVAATAGRYFDQGFYCAESVLAAVAEHLDVRSPLIPGIATGFCSGMAGTRGFCGSISGGVMAINMVLGRRVGSTPVTRNYDAVRELIQDFQCRHGSTQCSELIACDLDSKEGRSIYRNNHLRQQCREYVATAADASLRIIRKNSPADDGSSDRN
ncbi:MAG: acetyltransferase, N-acetylglutamate synthase [Rhodocyclaceae bacterium]|nr:acetyltransferase, N-acetylglutamate synthase [Rhodocyclaceae bacterium]